MSNKNSEDKTMYLPIFMCIGLSIGMAIGAALGNIPLYMCIGLSIGVGIGACIDSANQKKKTEQGEEDVDSKNDESSDSDREENE